MFCCFCILVRFLSSSTATFTRNRLVYVFCGFGVLSRFSHRYFTQPKTTSRKGCCNPSSTPQVFHQKSSRVCLCGFGVPVFTSLVDQARPPQKCRWGGAVVIGGFSVRWLLFFVQDEPVVLYVCDAILPAGWLCSCSFNIVVGFQSRDVAFVVGEVLTVTAFVPQFLCSSFVLLLVSWVPCGWTFFFSLLGTLWKGKVFWTFAEASESLALLQSFLNIVREMISMTFRVSAVFEGHARR